MAVTLDEMKNYLRVDFEDDDALVEALLAAARRICLDILRSEDEALLEDENGRIAVMYTAAYLYEHREDADHHGLTLTLRSLLFGQREEGF